jgi:transposase
MLNEGYTQEKVSKLLKVGTTSIKRWKAEIEKHGSIRCYYNTSNRNAVKLPEDKLREYFKDNPDAFLREAAEHFNCDTSAVFYACKRYRITYKKRQHATKSAMSKNAKNLSK